MPSINSLLSSNLNLKGYHPVMNPPKPPVTGLVSDSPINVYSRCPVPQIGNASSDSLGQSDRKGAIPQYRAFVLCFIKDYNAKFISKSTNTGGAFQDSEGYPLSNGWLILQLSHDSNVAVLGGPTGAQVVAGIKVKLLLNTLGNVTPGQFLWTNDALTPLGSYYRVVAYNSRGIQVWAFPQIFFIEPFAASIDIGTIQPSIP